MVSLVDHASEVLSVLRSSRVTLYDGQVPDNPSVPYVVVYFDQGNPRPTTVNSGRWMQHFIFQTTYVAESAAQLRIIADKVEDVLRGTKLDVYRTATTPVEKRSTQSARTDLDVRPPRVYSVDTWEYHATA